MRGLLASPRCEKLESHEWILCVTVYEARLN
jgi:hypothetical protein